MKMVNDEEAKIKDIEIEDDDIDLTINHDSRLYSTQSCYECDNTSC